MSYDYIVVGGGISGLYVALKLINGKNKILLIERNNRLGGRLQTYDDKKIKYEIGGARFHKGHKKLFELIKMFNLEDKIFPIKNDKTFIPIKNKFKKKYETNKLIDKILDNSKKFKKDALLKINFNQLCDKILTKEECLYLKASFEYVSELEDLNAYEAVDSFQNDLSYKFQFYLFKNGFSELIELMEKYLKENNCEIKLNHTLRDLKKKGETYHLNTININKNKLFKTKNLILALDKTPLLSIKYLSPIKSLLESVKKIPLMRIYAIYPLDPKTKKSWFHNIGKVTTDIEIKYIIPYNPQMGLIMISYTDQELAEYWNKILDQGPKKLELELSKQLKRLFPKKNIPKPTYLKGHYWHNGVHFWDKGKEAEEMAKKINRPFVDENLYICGTTYSQRQGWVEGALESGDM